MYALAPGSLTEYSLEDNAKTVYDIPAAFSSLIADGERLILISDNEARYFNKEETQEQGDDR